MSNITLALADLKTQLATVATTKTDRDALETTSATLPVITLVSISDAPASNQDAYETTLYTRRAMIEYKCTAGASYQTTLDNALTAIRALFVQTSGQFLSGYAYDIRETGSTFYHPADGSKEAALQVGIEIDWT